MKVAVAGKGGVGKTSISAGLILLLAERGEPVLAVDADSNNCLGYALVLPEEQLREVRPLVEMRELLSERAGATQGPIFNLNPQVADLIERFSLRHNSLRLLVMGTIGEGGGGCACPENAVLRALLRELVDLPEHIVVDMEAGLEHLGRGTVQAMDELLVVTLPTPAALRTVQRIARLAADLRMKRVRVIANQVRSADQADEMREELAPLELVGTIGMHPDLPTEAILGSSAGAGFRRELEVIVERLTAEGSG